MVSAELEKLKMEAQRRAYQEALRQEVVEIEFAHRDQDAREELRRSVRSRPASLNPTRFLNRAEVRRYLLELASTSRPANNFTRVGEVTLRDINERVRGMLVGLVHRAPSRGRTL